LFIIHIIAFSDYLHSLTCNSDLGEFKFKYIKSILKDISLEFYGIETSSSLSIVLLDEYRVFEVALGVSILRKRRLIAKKIICLKFLTHRKNKKNIKRDR